MKSNLRVHSWLLTAAIGDRSSNASAGEVLIFDIQRALGCADRRQIAGLDLTNVCAVLVRLSAANARADVLEPDRQ